MTITLAFDVYGTLIDTHGVISELQIDIQNFKETYGDARWFKSINNRLNQIGYPPDGVRFETDSAVRISHLLIDDPLSGGIANLEGIMEEQE